MQFRPANEHHAIDAAGVTLGLDKPLPWTSIDAVVKSRLPWRDAVPAVDLAQLVDVQINPQTGSPVNRVVRGVEFSHKRPDGTAEWSLTAVGQEIAVQTSKYTRWSEFWSKAGDLLLDASGQIAAHDNSRTLSVSSVALVMTDAFYTAEELPDFHQLFVSPSELLPLRVFNRGPVWHAYSGWFEDRPEGTVLNQLNIDVRKGIRPQQVSSLEDRISVSIQHNQVFRLRTVLPFDGSHDAQLSKLVLEEIPLMHRANKDLIRTLLTSEMQTLINITADA